ncbi:MAG: NAD(P)-binding domain-containing protein [Xanthobacteraceae bacterium]
MSPARKDVDLEVAIVGAGPFGLGAAAHLKAAQVDVGVFGESFSFWRDHMPRGMFIRSSWDATHLSDPQRRFTLNAYSRQCGFARPELMSLQDFLACADWFQANTVPDVDRRNVARIEQEYGGFRLTLSDGDTVKAARVVIATGLINQEFKPAPFAGIDKEYVSHAVDHADLSKFRGKRVAVVGRGQSACETAAILSDEGADVELIARGAVHWLGGPTPGPYIEPASRSLMYRLKWAPGGVGPFPISWLNELPGLERHLPRFALDWVNARSLRAGATGWIQPRFSRVRITAGKQITDVRAAGGHIGIAFEDRVCAYDHVILGTGYHIDIAKLGFLASPLLNAIRQIDGSPKLGAGFMSSVPGLHFLGANAVKSYGPAMRFIAGADYTGRELTRAVLAGRKSLVKERRRVPRTAGLAKQPGVASR